MYIRNAPVFYGIISGENLKTFSLEFSQEKRQENL
jgi:hypothetical protein